jgi:predicted dehydrogenase
LSDIGPHAVDLLDAALGPISDVLAAHRTRDDLWHLTLEHAGGATSTASLSLRLPLRPPVVEVAVYGEQGYRPLPDGTTSSQDCYTALLDEFLVLVHSGSTAHPCDVRRGLHLQRVLDAARQLAEGTV